MLYACDLLKLDGEDLHTMALVDRKRRLAMLLGRRRRGIVLSAHTAEDGANIASKHAGAGRIRVPFR